jgi:two-component system, NarL family, sensor kinase
MVIPHTWISMHQRLFFVPACTLVIFFVLSSGCISPPMVTEEPLTMTPGELASFVRDAAGYANLSGKEAALREFNRDTGSFTRGDLYIYAYDYNGTLLAHPYLGESIGMNRLNWTDLRGLPVIRIGAHVATYGGGYIAYLYPSPHEGLINESSRESYVVKIGYVYPAGDDMWIGSGIYCEDLEEGSPGAIKNAVPEMTTLVEQGAAYGRDHGDVAAFAEISNRSGMFVDPDAHYLYAYDYHGTLLAHPHLPNLIGTSLIERQDPFGMNNIRALSETARSGGGYIVFVWPNPERENRQELKIGYVLPVDEEWWLGSGVYLSEITGVDTSFPVPTG